MMPATLENEIMVSENGLPAPPPHPNAELINFFQRVGTTVGTKSLTPLCLVSGLFSLPGETLDLLSLKWNLGEQRILLTI